MDNKLTQSYILWKAKNKDVESFGKFYDLYIDRVFRFIFFKVSDKELAQDFAADVFLKTWEYINSGKKIDNLNALVYKIARNMVIDHYRKKSHEVSLEQEMLEIQADLAEIERDPINLEQEIDVKMELEHVLAKISELKDEYREILLLKHIEQLSIKEICEILEKKSGVVRVTLHRANKALQELL